MPLHFLGKDFEILDLNPPNNPTSHYGACHFGYNLALRLPLQFGIGKNSLNSIFNSLHSISNSLHSISRTTSLKERTRAASWFNNKEKITKVFAWHNKNQANSKEKISNSGRVGGEQTKKEKTGQFKILWPLLMLIKGAGDY